MTTSRILFSFVLIVAGACVGSSSALAQGHGRPVDMTEDRREPPPPIRITMKELHAQGGVPRRWKFLMPPGDPVAGRNVFVALECFACHEVKGEDFPASSKTPRVPLALDEQPMAGGGAGDVTLADGPRFATGRHVLG